MTEEQKPDEPVDLHLMKEEQEPEDTQEPEAPCSTCGKDAEQFVDGDCPDCNPPVPVPEPIKKVEHNVFVRADCGCRFQIVSALPVLNAGVLAMPDIDANVCATHRARQEEVQAKAKEDAKKPKIALVDASERPMDIRTIVRRRDR